MDKIGANSGQATGQKPENLANSTTAKCCQECSRKQNEIDKLRDEIRTLESEMEEMHDNFKEEESEQFEQLKQELDGALKNCKILQIKLNKSERQYSQLEQVKVMLEQQLLEESKKRQQSPQAQHRNSRQGSQDGALFELLPGEEFVKLPTREYDQLLRDLSDTSERELDLQEQIKYSQEEAQLKSERLSAVECENEVLLDRINKLMNANSNLRSTLLSNQQRGCESQDGVATTTTSALESKQQRDLIEQNGQLKLALELAQAEIARLRVDLAELQAQARERTKLSAKSKQAESDDNDNLAKECNQAAAPEGGHTQAALEMECRQLRARLVRHEREQRQMRAQLEALRHESSAKSSANQPPLGSRSRSMEESEQCKSGNKCQVRIRQLGEQRDEATRRMRELEQRLAGSMAGAGGSQLEHDLLDKLKRQLENSENELAKARSRLVELDIECSKAQRQHRRLLDSFESCGSDAELQALAARRLKLPSEPMREAMSRADLREAVRELESIIEELASLVQAKECLVQEQQQQLARLQAQSDQSATSELPDVAQRASLDSVESQQLKSLRRILDQERLLSGNLKLDVANLERECGELRTQRQLVERECRAMDEELDRLRKLGGELRVELEESQQEKNCHQTRAHELSETVDKLRLELAEAQRMTKKAECGAPSESEELLVMARNLSELKVKNGFLMRQVELARDEAQRQLDEARESADLQQKRAVELAQLEMREKQLAENQQLRDELGELRQKLASAQRLGARHEEELGTERDRVRALERDWRRDKSQWQQAREQLEGQLSIERRSTEFKLKEAEAVVRDKERANLALHDRCVQLERDIKRFQNKYQLLEEDCESRLKNLARELEHKSRELNECSARLQSSEAQNFGQLKKLSDDNRQLSEALESLKQTYECRLQEARKMREMLAARQEQTFHERQQNAEQVTDLARRLNEAQEGEMQAKLLRQRLETLERQHESARRDLVQVRDERARLKTRCEELERRELIARTSSISSSSILRPFVGQARQSGTRIDSPSSVSAQQRASSMGRTKPNNNDEHNDTAMSVQTIEKLSGKINDQRNLIQMLRQQLSETQLDLKQMKLLQASERSKWQTRVAVLTSRINECEERLAFEMTNGWLGGESQAILLARGVKPKLELQFDSERQAHLELIQQQQNQIDSLARDLKKVSQAYDMLRLHSKQLESNNNKLAKRLIEFQQQQPLVALAQSELEARHERLTMSNARLRAEMRPLVEIVTKMLASLDAPEQQPSVDTKARITSTNRPLRAPSPAQQRSDDESILTNVGAQQSRFSRLLVGNRPTSGTLAQRTKSSQNNEDNDDEDDECGQSMARKTTKRPLKRVRIKCSSLGITTNEKRQLKQQLKAISESLDEPAQVDDKQQKPKQQQQQQQPLLQKHSRLESIGDEKHVATNAVKWQQPMATSSSAGQPDSDIDSDRSWSLEPTTQPRQQRLDSYRRFPQAMPANRPVASLTDYESESSVASDFVIGKSKNGGAESDSGISPGNRAQSKSKHKVGLRGRVAGTLRTISRSIQGLGSAQASDNEEDRVDTGRKTVRTRLNEIRV